MKALIYVVIAMVAGSAIAQEEITRVYEVGCKAKADESGYSVCKAVVSGFVKCSAVEAEESAVENAKRSVKRVAKDGLYDGASCGVEFSAVRADKGVREVRDRECSMGRGYIAVGEAILDNCGGLAGEI